jgi:hypothetical protein
MLSAPAGPAAPSWGGRPLDPDRPNPEPERPASEPSQAQPAASAAGGETPGSRGGGDGPTGAAVGWSGGGPTGPDAEAPGLIAQVKATKAAVLGMVRAHIALARAEADAIKGEVAYAAAFAGIAVASLLLLGIFLPIAMMLFLGEWLFGSIGWGILLGTELLIAVAATAVVVGLRLSGPIPAAAVGLIAGVVAFIVFGASWFNRLWTTLGANANLAIDAAYRPLVVGIVVVAVIVAVVGFIAGARAAGVGGAIAGLIGGLLAGGLIGAFLCYDFGWRVGAALGFATAYAVYLGVLGGRVAAGGIDVDAIKLRFWPQQTIDTAKETIEWAKARNPLGPKS